MDQDNITYPAYWICYCATENKIDGPGWRFYCSYCDGHKDHYDLLDDKAYYKMVEGVLVQQETKPSWEREAPS